MMRHLALIPHYHELSGVALELITMIADQRHLCTTDILKKMKELNVFFVVFSSLLYFCIIFTGLS